MINFPNRRHLTPARQRGASLLVGLIMLLVMTMIGITAMRLSNSQLLVTNSFQNEQEAFVAAENSLRAGEHDLAINFAGAPAFNFANGGDGYYHADGVAFYSPDWSGISYQSGDDAHEQYVIEYIGPAPAAGGSLALGAGSATSMQFVYRITGRGSSSKGSVRLAQSIYSSIE